jgi:N,N'-diacetyllegionaminate synthase
MSLSNKFQQRPFVIEGTQVGNHRPPYVIAEIAQTHEGSLGAAMAFIDLAKECGADAVKFQTHIAAEESTAREPWRKRFSHQDETRFDYWKRMEFTFAQWQLLKRHADDVGIAFISSPFSVKACEWLHELGMRTWKIASGEVHNRQLMDWILATNDPIILSSGLSLSDESRRVMCELTDGDRQVAFLHCTTQYPTPASQIGLNVFSAFKREFSGLPVGLSDHSGQIYPALVATYLGADIIEVHLTMHARMFGPDVKSSLNPEQLRELVQGTRFAWEMRNHPVDKSEQLDALQKERNIFTRSLVAARDLAAGETLIAAMVAYKKPGGGLPYEALSKLIGKTLRCSIARDEPLSLNDVE